MNDYTVERIWRSFG